MLFFTLQKEYWSSLSSNEIMDRINAIIENHSDKSVLDQQLDSLINFRLTGFASQRRFLLHKWAPDSIREYRDNLFNNLSELEGTVSQNSIGSSITISIYVNAIYKKLFFAFLLMGLIIFTIGYNQESFSLMLSSLLAPGGYLVIVNIKLFLFYQQVNRILIILFMV